MSHEITIREDGFAEMAYSGGEAPWHGLGQQWLETDTPEERRKKCGFDWEAKRSTVRYVTRGNVVRVARDQNVIYRSDNLEPLAVVSSRYYDHQPKEILQYMEDLATNAGFTLDTAGTLFGGRQFWALARVGDPESVIGNDTVQRRLLLATSLDRSLATTAKFVDERVVCHNTLTAAREESGKEVRQRHRSEFNPKLLNEKMGIHAAESFSATMAELRKLANTHMDAVQMVKATLVLLEGGRAVDADADELAQILKKRPVRRIAKLAIEHQTIGGDLAGNRQTAWGWLNAVTQYVDHESKSRTQDWRLFRAWFGDGEKMKNRALDIAADRETWGQYKLPNSQLVELALV